MEKRVINVEHLSDYCGLLIAGEVSGLFDLYIKRFEMIFCLVTWKAKSHFGKCFSPNPICAILCYNVYAGTFKSSQCHI